MPNGIPYRTLGCNFSNFLLDFSLKFEKSVERMSLYNSSSKRWILDSVRHSNNYSIPFWYTARLLYCITISYKSTLTMWFLRLW